MAISSEKKISKTKSARGLATQAKIEQSAVSLFLEQGIDATTTRDIAERAGISEGAIYRHYESKTDLAFELFRRVHVRLADLLEEAHSAEKTLEGKVRAIVSAYCTVADEDWAAFSYHLRFHHIFLIRYGRKARNPVDVVEAAAQELIEAGEIKGGDKQLVCSMALGVVFQTAAHLAFGRMKGHLGDHISSFERGIVAMLRAL